MGCFLSLHFGVRESERRNRRREEQQNLEISSGTDGGVAGADEEVIFCPQSESFETPNVNNGNVTH